jgi:hypothetical protein
MAEAPLATKGNYLHIYDFRVKPGMAEKFIELFSDFDYSDINPAHKSPAQVKDSGHRAAMVAGFDRVRRARGRRPHFKSSRTRDSRKC